ncbi:Concanavalin A-like lectin/glucanases superfamily [uncultured Caudovirales phage]|uniref:Concanavalin A-like lectin/glucanases superfamily n=1 Tax=uncultured Caudovirales phage TaxID=2100421 RepID=A0A6J5PPD3_9CAUD|nr:Concanavalin A-like lectin/glucanases superfamily [uncultured Caudovirales phage]CAB4171085.1 Concanavalin A-like lectin/glucanases superfamily [uncultured Caudovirales phage]CAB4176580.1 Concanavalin A-like lectin/glucanases superfamily [uncultured Caudovirales phage]CAB4223016.1 Concanavalin A-like lectin/glucanases superfamily [uncultured Caudovirales phage]
MAITIGGYYNTTNLMCYLDSSNATSYPGTGTVWTDLSGNSRNGTLVGSPTYSNNSIVFNGTNYVSLGNFGVFPTTGTISFLLNSSAVESYRNPFHTHYTGTASNIGIRFEQNSQGSIGVNIGNDAGTAQGWWLLDAGFKSNTWFYLTVSWNTTTNIISGYVNGRLIWANSNTYWATQMPTVTLGGGFDTSRLFKGSILNLSIYNRVLSQAEILSNYAALGLLLSDGSVQISPAISSNTGKLLSISSFPTAGTSTWTKPGGCTNVIVKVVGGGGGASAYCESGGAGGYSEKRIDVTAVSTVSVTVGAGAAQAAYAGGTNGGTSSFGTYCSATGGYGSNQNFSHSGGHGGIGSSGDINLYGGSGTGHTNTSGHGALGNGGQSYWGGGNNLIGRHQNPGGFRDAAPGSGGCGGVTDAGTLGSAGQTGLVVIWEYT